MDDELYEEVSLEEALRTNVPDYCHAAHVMLYAEWPEALFDKYPFKYAVMLQMRFDGTLGFPGGIVDQGETPEEAVTRELAEELGGGVKVQRCDHIITSISSKTKFCLHFYAKQVLMSEFKQLEGGIMTAKDWSSEVLGVLRCPLYTLPNGLGLPAFLTHTFIGNSKHQLLVSLERRGLLSPQDIQQAKVTSTKVNSYVSKDDILI